MKKLLLVAAMLAACSPRQDGTESDIKTGTEASGPMVAPLGAHAGTNKLVTWTSDGRGTFTATYRSIFSEDDGWVTLGCFDATDGENQVFIGQSETKFVKGFSTTTFSITSLALSSTHGWVQCDLIRTGKGGFSDAQKRNELHATMMIGAHGFPGPGLVEPGSGRGPACRDDDNGEGEATCAEGRNCPCGEESHSEVHEPDDIFAIKGGADFSNCGNWAVCFAVGSSASQVRARNWTKLLACAHVSLTCTQTAQRFIEYPWAGAGQPEYWAVVTFRNGHFHEMSQVIANSQN